MVEASAFLRSIGVRQTEEPWVFEGVSPPLGMGNVRPIAYGGYAIATGIVAAGQTIPSTTPHFVPYSLLGHFLGPANLQHPFVCHVTSVRDTRTFATRSVLVKQLSKGGEFRNVLSMTLDFIASPNSEPEKIMQLHQENIDPSCVGSLLRYDPITPWKIERPEELPKPHEYTQQRLADGYVDEFIVDLQHKILGLWSEIFDTRSVPSCMMQQNSIGMMDVPTTQDQLPLVQRRTFDWMRAREKLPTANSIECAHGTGEQKGMLPISSIIAHVATIAFALDGALSFAPLSLAKQSFLSASAASTLEFATRFHTDVLDINQYLLREIQPIHAGWQRTFSEARLFDTTGRLVASCSQQGVMRPADENAIATPQVPPPFRPAPKL